MCQHVKCGQNVDNFVVFYHSKNLLSIAVNNYLKPGKTQLK